MNRLIHNASVLLSRLNQREQRLVGLFGVLLALASVWVLLLEPLMGLRDGLRDDVQTLQQELVVLEELGRRVSGLERSGAKTVKREPDPDFSLLAFVDRIASASVAAESVEAMSPSKRRVDASSEESSVELRLTSVSLEEAVALLTGLERSPNPVFVKQFELRKRYDDDSRFDLTMVAAAIVQS